MEFGERLADALRREIQEEYGMEIEVGALLDVVDHILPEEGQHWVSPTYICTLSKDGPEANRASWSRGNAPKSAGSSPTARLKT